MFRKMRRTKQELTQKECVEILKNEPRGILSVLGDDGYPYGLPINHWYDEEDGKLYFHGAKSGHKIDAIKAYDKVSYCVYDEGYRNEGDWALNIKSVIVFGRIKPVEDYDKAMKICAGLYRKFDDDEERLKCDLEKSGRAVLCLELTPENMTGKLVNES